VASLQSRSLSIRVSKYAEDLHIARALSKPLELDARTLQAWKKKVKEPEWNRLPPQEHRTAGYELDALQDIHALSYNCHVLLEIRDVRLPASTHHPSFTRLARHRKHLICYTHADMINGSTRDRVQEWTERSWPKAQCKFVDTREERPDSKEAFEDLYQWILGTLQDSNQIYALTVGVPNTGKSSVLQNLLRYAREKGHIKKQVKVRATQFTKKGKKAKTNLAKGSLPAIQDKPGKTRELNEYLIHEIDGKYRKYFLDVPGMSPPDFFFQERPEAWYGFGAANLLTMTNIMTQDAYLYKSFCEYLLYCLNRDGRFEYVRQLKLKEPTKDIDAILSKFANRGSSQNEERLLLKRCTNFLKLFQTGNFGPVILDDISRRYKPFLFKDSHFRRKKSTPQNAPQSAPEDDDWWEELTSRD